MSLTRRQRRGLRAQMRHAKPQRFVPDAETLLLAATPTRLDAAYRWGHALGDDRVLLVADEMAPVLRSLPRKVDVVEGILVACLALSELPMVFPGYDAEFAASIAPAPGHVGVVIVAGESVGFYDHPVAPAAVGDAS